MKSNLSWKILALVALLPWSNARADIWDLHANLVATEQTTDFEVAPVFAQLSTVGRHTDTSQQTAWDALRRVEEAQRALTEAYRALPENERTAFLEQLNNRPRSEILLYDFEPFSALIPRIAEIRREQQERLDSLKGRAMGFDLNPRALANTPINVDPVSSPEINGANFGANQYALTFDDGPNRRTTQVILDSLRNFSTFATFFQLGERVVADPAMVREIFEAGHTVANHSWNHPQMTNLDLGTARSQVVNTSNALANALNGLRPTLFRFPYGARNPSVRSVVNAEGLTSVMWNIDTLDWKYRDPETIVDLARTQISQQGRGIILMHDIHPQTTMATPYILQILADRNATVVRLNAGGR